MKIKEIKKRLAENHYILTGNLWVKGNIAIRFERGENNRFRIYLLGDDVKTLVVENFSHGWPFIKVMKNLILIYENGTKEDRLIKIIDTEGGAVYEVHKRR